MTIAIYKLLLTLYILLYILLLLFLQFACALNSESSGSKMSLTLLVLYMTMYVSIACCILNITSSLKLKPIDDYIHICNYILYNWGIKLYNTIILISNIVY